MNRKWYPATNQPVAFLAGALFFGVGLFMQGNILLGDAPIRVNRRLIEHPTLADKLPFVAFLTVFVLVGGLVALSSFSGYWIDDEGITSRSFFRLKTIRWADIVEIRKRYSGLDLLGSNQTIRVYRNYKWDELRAAIETKLPQKLSPPDRGVRPTNKYAGNPSGVYRSKSRKVVPIIVAICAVVFVFMFLSVFRMKFEPAMAIMFCLQLLFMGAIGYVAMRARLEIQSDAFVYTPSLGKTVRIPYSDIRSMSYETRTTDKGQVYNVWVVEGSDGKKTTISSIDDLDKAGADIASRMPENAIYRGPGALD